ncbi:cyclophilin-like domain-containing protein [Scheffersomyces amazonensis]|uniref:cyclophilin-like domain-containing protein n=1 Tax=Scheffersomyces amazonensis TaxID=1078765 RepID=UPI00315DE34C
MKVEEVRPHAYLDVSIGDKPVGRIVVELYEDLAPESSKNFLELVKGTKKVEDKQGNINYYSYKNNIFHRAIKNFVIQAGDLIYGSIKDNKESSIDEENLGKGSLAMVGDNLIEDENLDEPIDSSFKLCMAHEPDVKDCNNSQFFITCSPQPHLNGHHSVFGQVKYGKSVVREIERVSTIQKSHIPKQLVIITDCGEWDESMEIPIFNACYDTIGGDIYEEYPDDDQHIDKDSSESVYNASVKVKESGTLLFKNGKKQEAYLKWKKCIRYIMEYIPDEDQEPEWNQKYMELKKKVYLNLSLVCFQLNQYHQSVDYCDFLLDIKSRLTSQELAKINYRKGLNLIQFKKYKEALKSLKTAHELLPNDELISREVDKCQGLIDEAKLAEKVKYAKFFK